MPIKTAYGKKPRVRHDTGTQSHVKQSFKNECDINLIMAKYQKTGVVTHVRQNAETYGFAPAVSFHTAMNLITKATEQFDGLPSKVRKRFNNNPAEFLKFCEQPDNRSEAALLGLLEPSEPATESPPAQPSDSLSAPQAPNPADTEPSHESA